MKKIFICGFLIFYFLPGSAQQSKLTLQQCVETAIANNNEVLQGDLQVQRDEIDWKQSKLNMLPDLFGNANHGVNQGRSIDPFTNTFINQNVSYAGYGLSSGVTLFNGFAMQNTVKQNKLIYEASKMTLQQRKDDLTFSIIAAYMDILNAEDVLVQAQNQIIVTGKQLERLELLNKEGGIPPSQLYDVKGQNAGEQLVILSNQAALENAKIALCRLMNIPYDKNISVERLDPLLFARKYDDTPDKIYEIALQQFAAVKAVTLSAQSAEKSVKVAKGYLSPQLTLNGNVQTNYSNAATVSTFINTTDVISNDYVIVNGNQTPVIRQQNNFSTSKINYSDQLKNNRYSQLNLGLRIPIFNSFDQRNRVKLAKIDLKSSELAVKNVKTQLQQSIEQAHLNMKTSSERHKILIEQVDAFAESFRIAETRFNAGLDNSYDYLTAKNNLDRANLNLIYAKYDYVFRTKILDYYKGIKLW